MDEQQYQLFEAYFNGELSKAETTTFEKRLQTEPDFADSYRAFLQAVKFIRTTDLKLQAQNDPEIERIRTDYKKQLHQPVVRPLRRIAATAAALIGAVFLAWLLWPSGNRPIAMYQELDISASNKELSDKILEERPRGFANQEDLQLFEGLQRYRDNKPDDAIQILQAYSEARDRMGSDTLFYFLGETYRDNGEMEKALSEYTKMSDGQALYNRKYFSIALVSLHLEKQSQAIDAANRVLNNQDTLFNERAAKMIKS